MTEVAALQAEVEALKEALEREKLKGVKEPPDREPEASVPSRLFVSQDREIPQFLDRPLSTGGMSVTDWIADVQGYIKR